MSERYHPPGMEHTSEAYELLIDKWMHALTGSELKVFLYYARHTVGFGKARDAISLEQLCGGIVTRNGKRLDFGTGLTRTAALKATRRLEERGLVSRTVRPNPQPAECEILWSVVMDSQKQTGLQNEPVTGIQSRPVPVYKVDPQLSYQPSSVQPSVNCDLDCPPANRKNRDSRSDPQSPQPPKLAQYPRLREALALYMWGNPDEQKVYPTDRQVVDIVDAAQASEEEIIGALRYFYNERGLRPGTENGPRSFAWFKTVLQDYFAAWHSREMVANPCGYEEWADRNQAREIRKMCDNPPFAVGE